MTRFIFILLLLVSFAPAMAIAATDGGKAADVPDIPKIQAYEVSGMRMNVPVGYLRRFDLPPDQTLRIRNTSGQSIQLHLQDPEMISPSPELRKRLRSPRNSPEHVLFRVIIVRDDYTETHLSAIMRKAMIVGKCRAKIAGEICPDSRDLPLRETWETLYTGEKHEFVFCRTWGGVPVPHCETERILVDGIIVETFFDRRIMNFADPVWDRIYSLVCSWIDLPADHSLTINRCRNRGIKRSN